jgi:ABC-type multidrug transport system fused ATPase/permease subunit
MGEDQTFLAADDQDEKVLKKNAIGDIKSFFMLLKHARKYWPQISLSLFIILLSNASNIISARLSGDLIEKGLMAKDSKVTYILIAIILALETLAMFFQWKGRKILAKYSSLSLLEIRKKIFSHLQELPVVYFDKNPQGRIVTRITHDVEGVEEFFTSSLGRLTNSLFMVVLSSAAMLFTDVKLGAILIFMMLPAVIQITLTKKPVRNIQRKISKFSSELNARLSEFLSGLEVIRHYGLEKWSLNKYQERVDNYLNANLKANTLYSFLRPFNAFSCGIPLIALVWFGGHRVMEGLLSVGLFVAFVRYYERFYGPVIMLSREIHTIQQAFTSAERVASFLNEKTEDDLFDTTEDIEQNFSENEFIKGHIHFDNVWMAYDKEDWVLKDVQFKIKAGENIGLVGSTGSGKTTAVSLLSRLYDFQKGGIFVDGQELRSFDRSFLRKNIGFVSQDAILFKGSLKANLVMGHDFSDAEIESACLETGLKKVMKGKALGLDFEIFENGSNLSEGQKQLIALTRVILSNPSLLVLDEATANIDLYHEELIHKAVATVMKGRTCLTIAHRLDTILSCDRLLVFENGKLVEEGSPENLLEDKGHFYSLQMAMN